MLNATPGPDRALTEAAADDEWFARWRRQELGRVEAAGLCYLDYTGTALYAASLVEADAERLKGAVLGNPHSEHRASLDSTTDLEHAREAILDFLNADPAEFEVVITANASGACRLVGEGFPFGPDRGLLLTADNHNSVNGIREFARARGAPVVTIPLDPSLRLSGAEAALRRERGAGGALFGFPAQSNFSGVRHDLSLVSLAQELGYRVLLDAAALLPTSNLDLRRLRPDFLALSLYKITGYPSGVGALVARSEALAELTCPWFSGGTVNWVTTAPARHRLREGGARFEDGTPPFL
ncbi:MAG TPA: aminotransferase class V-fold PLP-dependent enzyme, partial [Gemmatimonadales bacterium]|nr:aminotransferase class V-fold PLP-dependent enzyme [Gemmatimonadales bacterium]